MHAHVCVREREWEHVCVGVCTFVCVCACVCMCMCVCASISLCVCMHMHVIMCTSVDVLHCIGHNRQTVAHVYTVYTLSHSCAAIHLVTVVLLWALRCAAVFQMVRYNWRPMNQQQQGSLNRSLIDSLHLMSMPLFRNCGKKTVPTSDPAHCVTEKSEDRPCFWSCSLCWYKQQDWPHLRTCSPCHRDNKLTCRKQTGPTPINYHVSWAQIYKLISTTLLADWKRLLNWIGYWTSFAAREHGVWL